MGETFVMGDESAKVKGLLTDLRSGVSFSELMRKYNLTDDGLNKILRKLKRRDLSALQGLFGQDKLSESQFMRAFTEIEEDLKRKD
jgi:hypothetical protein